MFKLNIEQQIKAFLFGKFYIKITCELNLLIRTAKSG